MGWDVDAVYDGIAFNYVETDRDPLAADAFRLAAEEARRVSGSCDAFLEQGKLDVSDCVRALAKHAGETDRSAIWNPVRTRALHESINWPDLGSLSERERWIVASARAFLQVCAEQGYGIQFDP